MSEHEPRVPSDDLDRAIDAVARDMVDVDAPASMRASVLAHLDAGPPAGWIAGLHRPAVWAAAAAGIAVAIGLWVSLPFEQEQPQPARAGAIARGTAASAPAPVVHTMQGAVSAAAATTGAAEPSGTTTPAAAARPRVRPGRPGPGAAPEGLPRLAAIEPLGIDPLASPSLTLEDIRVTPMGDVPTLELPGLDEVLPEEGPANPDRKER